MMHRDIYLCALAYTLGESLSVSDLQLDDDTRSRLLGSDGGLCRHLVSVEDSIELAASSAAKSLQLANDLGIGPERIDALMVASNSLHATDWMEAMQRLTVPLGLGHAETVLISSGDCCNFHVGLRHCHSMVRARQYRNILFVTTDRVADACQGQYVAVRGAGINSDSSASCLVSGEASTGIVLGGHFEQIRDPQLLALDTAKNDDFIKVIAMVRQVAKGVYTHHGWRPENVSKLITNTYTRAVSELLAMAARLPAEAAYSANIGRTGHCFAADNIINLLDFITDEAPPPGTRLLLLGSGVHQWAATAVEIGRDPVQRI